MSTKKFKFSEIDNITSCYYSHNGYPVFDIMVPTQPGFAGASNIVYYSENETEINKVRTLRSSEYDEFINKNQHSLYRLQDLRGKVGLYSATESQDYARLLRNFDSFIENNYKRIVCKFNKDSIEVYTDFNFQRESITNNEKHFQENNQIAQEKFEKGEMPLLVIKGNSVDLFFKSNPITKKIYDNQKAVLSLNDKQSEAKEVFTNLLDSLFSKNEVARIISISDVLNMSFDYKNLNYKLTSYVDGKCSLGIENKENGNSTLVSYPSILKASVQVMRSVHEQKEQELINLIEAKIKLKP